jgi:NAD(P)-dependent dehydrogenase (short-subunit alcohol dehydrogenase family)
VARARLAAGDAAQQRGIGRAVACALAERGDRVMAVSRTEAELVVPRTLEGDDAELARRERGFSLSRS